MSSRRRWFRRSLLLSGLLIGLFVTGILLLPSLLSTRVVRLRLADAAGEALGRDVKIATLELAWGVVLRLGGVTIGERPEFGAGPLLSLRSLDLAVDLWDLVRGRLDLRLDVSGARLRGVRDPDGTTNLEALLSGLEEAPDEEPPRDADLLPLPVRILKVVVRGDDIALDWDDRATGGSARLTLVSLRADALSDGKPVALKVEADLDVRSRKWPLMLDVKMVDLLGPDGALTPQSAKVELSGAFPGVDLVARGSPGEVSSRLEGRAELDLADAHAAARPFLPPSLADLAVGGKAALEMKVELEREGSIGVEVSLSADGIRAAGGPLSGREVGPVGIRSRHSVRFRRESRKLSVTSGDLALGEALRVSWSADVRLPDPAAIAPGWADVTVATAALDLARTLRLAQSFLPPQWRGDGMAFPDGGLRLTGLRASGPLAAEPESTRHTVSLEKVALDLPRVSYAPKASGAVRLKAEGVGLNVSGLRAELAGGIPREVELEVSAAAARVSVEGDSPLELRDLTLPEVALSARQLQRAPTAPGGMTGAITLDQSLAIGEARLPGLGVVRNLRQSLRLRVATDGAGPVRADVEELGVEIGTIEVLPADRTVNVDDLSVRISSMKMELVDMFPRDLKLDLDLSARRIGLEGEAEGEIHGLAARLRDTAVQGLRPSEAHPLGWTGKARVLQAMKVSRGSWDGLLTLENLAQSMMVEADLTGTAASVIDLGGFTLAAAGLGSAILPEGQIIPIEADLQVNSLALRGKRPADVDVTGLELQLGLGETGNLNATLSARAGGREDVISDGTMDFDLGAAAAVTPAELRGDIQIEGRGGASWSVAGRLPAEGELDRLRQFPFSLFSSRERLPFIETLALEASLEDVNLDTSLPQGRMFFQGLSTSPRLYLSASAAGASIETGGGFEILRVNSLPGLPALPDPWRTSATWDAVFEEAGTLTMAHSMSIETLGISQKLGLQLSGLERVLKPADESVLYRASRFLEGSAEIETLIDENPDLQMVLPEMRLRGPLSAGVSAAVRDGRRITLEAFVEAVDAGVNFPGTLEMEGLDADLRVSRTLDLLRPGEEGREAGETGRYLSEAVLTLPEARVGRAGPVLSGTGGVDAGRVAARRVFLRGGPLPLEARDVEALVSFPGGLPVMERLQADLMGGSLLGGIGFAGETGGFELDGALGFTGVDLRFLAPGAEASGDSEVSGHVSFRAPLGGGVTTILDGLELEGGLTRVGADTLDRVLFALDPSESNESIVSQRKIVRLGSPKWVKVEVRDGNLALGGEVRAVGMDIDLPRLERFPISRVPGLDGPDAYGRMVKKLTTLLRLAGADGVVIDPDGTFRFTQFRKGEVP